MNQDICMESVHGRKSKSQTTFKAVLNKVLVSALILGTVAGMSTPAFAAEVKITQGTNDTAIMQEQGVSVSSAISSLRNTIATINEMKANGTVSSSQIKTLANQLYSLEQVAKGNVTSDVISVINDAESAIKGLSNATEAEVAIAVVKDSLGIDTVTASNKSEANQAVTSFSDVKSDHWAHSAIMAMTSKGLFSGKGQIINGVGRFAPDDTMSRAEFVTVVIRALYGEELTAMPESKGAWYQNAYTLAIQNGILERRDLGSGDLTKSMTRQEMSMVLVRAAAKNGEEPEALIRKDQIPDYDVIGTAYRDYVVSSYSMGMLAGTDSKGTFNPMGTLSRAQAATVLYRLVEPSSRAEVDFNKSVAPPTAPEGQGQVFNEGAVHQPPKAGDTVIKADGTRVVLKATKVGEIYILGYKQNVDHITGTTINGVVCTEEKLGGAWSDYNGNDLTAFLKDPLTGSVHTEYEWKCIKLATTPSGVGSYEGEKANTYFEWDTVIDAWVWVGPVNY